MSTEQEILTFLLENRIAVEEQLVWFFLGAGGFVTVMAPMMVMHFMRRAARAENF